ncbi:DUF2508 domain-containing protein, partial [Bacillus thuringiensis]|uniref:DUF2508 domain-containing protein n=1 Tax=Bacillus thuringiensis TaxID=1428 RepID=UPI001C92CDAF
DNLIVLFEKVNNESLPHNTILQQTLEPSQHLISSFKIPDAKYFFFFKQPKPPPLKIQQS